MDVMVWNLQTDQSGSTFYFYDLKQNTSSPAVYQAVNLPYNQFANTSVGAGDYFREADGTIWALGRTWGPGRSFLYQYNFGTNLTKLVNSETFIQTTAIKDVILPRALGGLTGGPAPTNPSLWTTKYSGSVLMLSESNKLWELNLNTPEKRLVTTLTAQVTALESFGTWDSLYAIVNGTSGASLARVNVTTGELSTVAALPALFTSLTRSSNGKLVAWRNLNETFGEYAIINSAGTIEMLSELYCYDTGNNYRCRHALLDAFAGGQNLHFLSFGRKHYTINATAGADMTTMTAADLLGGCPAVPDGQYGCTRWDSALGFNTVLDWTSAGSGYAYTMPDVSPLPLRAFFYMNLTSGDADNIVDLPITLDAIDFAHFQYNRAWCSNHGNWVGDMCSCEYGFAGSRCEITLPPPVAPPVAVPVAPPMAAPVDAPVATPVAGSKAPVAAKAPAISSASSLTAGLVSALVVVAALF
eukprot:TRINITY_DN7962_c0_g1_i1.p1 TRINITY_DN7962_c0_g1~~TRINITY_DN7962_c0_g1_i1.p1  ORF type:complete len:471 (+),score=107.24 TRINITY_DN7962_c0_g1_i1:1082-2494(+)